MRNHLLKVTFDCRTAAAIRRISEASGKSMSSVVAGFFDPHLACLEQLADALERVNSLREEAQATQEDFLDAVVSLVQEAEENDGQLPEPEDDAEALKGVTKEAGTLPPSSSPGQTWTLGAPGRPGHQPQPEDFDHDS